MTTRKTTWLTPFDDIHRELRGVPIANGRTAKALRPLVDEKGESFVVAAFRRFCASGEIKYGMEYFARNLADYAPTDRNPTQFFLDPDTLRARYGEP
jgi:hypothetical protein